MATNNYREEAVQDREDLTCINLDHNGDMVTIKALDNRKVYWMSHWQHVDGLVSRGILSRDPVLPGTFGHCDFSVR